MNVLACWGDCWVGVGWDVVEEVFGVCWAGDVVCWIRTEDESKIFESVPTLETKALIEEYPELLCWMIDILGTTMMELQDCEIRDVEASDLWEGKSWGNGTQIH